VPSAFFLRAAGRLLRPQMPVGVGFSPSRQSSSLLIVRSLPVADASPTMSPHLQSDDRLSILRAMDQFRSWSSLDDRRFCILCAKTFTGRQIEITECRGVQYELHCPTQGCNSRPHQWVYPGNPLISDAAYADWWRAFGEERKRPSASRA